MTSGIPFSDDEIAHIERTAYTRTWGTIARELACRYPEDNGGHRCGRSVRNWVRRQERIDEIVTVRARVPRELLTSAGVRPQDLEAVLVETLRAKCKA